MWAWAGPAEVLLVIAGLVWLWRWWAPPPPAPTPTTAPTCKGILLSRTGQVQSIRTFFGDAPRTLVTGRVTYVREGLNDAGHWIYRADR